MLVFARSSILLFPFRSTLTLVTWVFFMLEWVRFFVYTLNSLTQPTYLLCDFSLFKICLGLKQLLKLLFFSKYLLVKANTFDLVLKVGLFAYIKWWLKSLFKFIFKLEKFESITLNIKFYCLETNLWCP